MIDRYNNTSLAQTGFIVVVMGHRGGSPTRNTAYYKYGFGNIRDAGLADDKFGLEQLAAQYSFIDLNKLALLDILAEVPCLPLRFAPIQIFIRLLCLHPETMTIDFTIEMG